MITIALEFLRVLAWPVVALTFAVMYRSVIAGIAPSSTIKLNIFGVEIETTLPQVQATIEENFRGRKLSSEQWAWLGRLGDGRLIDYDHDHYLELRPLRNAGLIREYPEGHLTSAKEIEITQLGRLLLNAHGRQGQGSPPGTGG
ncbi:hypothetical protein [Paludisphaera sp.]|uniref:hypothetical protein n=1 Tax=Paludisphaera sp. TaxID=2017432 RepID=UPI00301DFDB2